MELAEPAIGLFAFEEGKVGLWEQNGAKEALGRKRWSGARLEGDAHGYRAGEAGAYSPPAVTARVRRCDVGQQSVNSSGGEQVGWEMVGGS